MFRRLPVERPHGEVVVLTLSDSKLFLKIRKIIELMASIKFLIIFSMAAFYFAIVSGCVWLDQFVPDAELREGVFK